MTQGTQIVASADEDFSVCLHSYRGDEGIPLQNVVERRINTPNGLCRQGKGSTEKQRERQGA